MNSSFRVCLIIPPGYQHAACFLETAILLKHALADNGYACDIVPNEFSRERINIVLGVHLLLSGEHLNNVRYIAYQLEQLSESEGVLSENLLNVLRNATAVWDYSQENIDFLKKQGIVATLVPPGYHAALEQINQATQSDFDFLFYGSIGPRRAAILNAISLQKHIRLKTAFGIYGAERDKLIGSSKIILNIHHYSARIFEAVRISYLLNNRCFVIAEESAVNPYPHVPIACAPYETFAATCMRYLENPNQIDELRLEAYDCFKKFYPMTEIIAAALKDSKISL